MQNSSASCGSTNKQAVEIIHKLWDHAKAVRSPATRIQPGWRTALDLHNLLTVSKRSRRRHQHRKPRRPIPRGLPGQKRQYGEFNIVIRKGSDGG